MGSGRLACACCVAGPSENGLWRCAETRIFDTLRQLIQLGASPINKTTKHLQAALPALTLMSVNRIKSMNKRANLLLFRVEGAVWNRRVIDVFPGQVR